MPAVTGFALSSAELYSPSTGTWALTGSLANARAFHSATLLPNGRVLAAGGLDAGVDLSSAELYAIAVPPVPAMPTWALLSLGATVIAFGIGLLRRRLKEALGA
jgi:hypothetical protein